MAAAVALSAVAPLGKAAPPASASEDGLKGDLYTFTIGKVDAGMAILIGERASLIEFPSILLPHGVTSGSVVNIRVHRNEAEEERQRSEFEQLQDEILNTFGRDSPKAPQLRLRNVTQTSVTLEWDRLYLATASLLSLDIYRNNQRLAPIPSPLHNTSTKLSGLDVSAEYTFHLVLRTTAGTFPSPLLRVKTHDIADTSGIAVCFGSLFGGGSAGSGDNELEDAAREALRRMGAREPTERIQIETTHFVCSDPRDRGAIGGGQGAMYTKAMQLNIPVVQPHWIFACYEQKRMVPISAYYLENDPPNATTLRETIHRILSKDSPPPPPAPKDVPSLPASARPPAAAAATSAAGAGVAAAAAAIPASQAIEATHVSDGDEAADDSTVEKAPEAALGAHQAEETISGVPIITGSDAAEEPPAAQPNVDLPRPIPSITVQAPASEADSEDRQLDHEYDGNADEDEQHQYASGGRGGAAIGLSLADDDSESQMEDISLGGDTPMEERNVTLSRQEEEAAGHDGETAPPAEEEIDLR
ncbi:Chitin synthase, class 5 [Tilletia horrida]|uniref:Chitin synthase, class 5 n=1 Tax=Tilletia horrida TaxID=155126 RepID=A0AAN6GG71_9BASI|nr:Chitin synthase, class 5 [Tilletia horrida]